MSNIKGKKISFVVGEFPSLGTWVLDQALYLQEQGADIEIFAFLPGEKSGVSRKFYDSNLKSKIRYLTMPENKIIRILWAIPKAFKILFKNPKSFFRAFDFYRYGRQAASLQLLFWVEPFLDKNPDLIHCHFGKVAVNFLEIRHILNLKQKIVTSFYGQDVSKVFRVKSRDYYDELKKVSSAFIVMSADMKRRVVEYGFPEKKVHILPVGIELKDSVFKSRTPHFGPVKIVSVGRFVEKKGFDDILRALKIVKERLGDVFNCIIVGGGPLEDHLHRLADDSNLGNLVDWRRVVPIQKVRTLFTEMDFFVQPSKTAADGDME